MVFRRADGHLTRRTVRVLSRMHSAAYRLTRGVVGRRLAGNDMLLLTTVGRRTGRTRTVPLLYVCDGDAYVVVASYGGRHHHPDWYLNLAAGPSTFAQIRGTRVPVTARTASPKERSRIWPLVIAAHEGYRVYQARTTREIPVVLLEPA
jgi:deazaflavin-dependent oxidoreductase (nitroreductase family)